MKSLDCTPQGQGQNEGSNPVSQKQLSIPRWYHMSHKTIWTQNFEGCVLWTVGVSWPKDWIAKVKEVNCVGNAYSDTTTVYMVVSCATGNIACCFIMQHCVFRHWPSGSTEVVCGSGLFPLLLRLHPCWGEIQENWRSDFLSILFFFFVLQKLLLFLSFSPLFHPQGWWIRVCVCLTWLLFDRQ